MYALKYKGILFIREPANTCPTAYVLFENDFPNPKKPIVSPKSVLPECS